MNETVMTVVGNIITEVRGRLTADGVRVASFRVASNERPFDKQTGQWVDGDRLYLTVICWRKLANNVLVSLSKGDPVVVTGRVFTRGFEVEGQRRSVTALQATAVGPDLSRCRAELARARGSATEDVGLHGRDGTDALSPPAGPAARSKVGDASGDPASTGQGAKPAPRRRLVAAGEAG